MTHDVVPDSAMINVLYLVEVRGPVPSKGAFDEAVNSGRHGNGGLHSTVELPQGHVISGADRPAADIASHSRPPIEVVRAMRHLLLRERLVQRSSETRE